MNNLIPDIGISIELIGFIILISQQFTIIKKWKRRERTIKWFKRITPFGIIVVIIGLSLQYSIFVFK